MNKFAEKGQCPKCRMVMSYISHGLFGCHHCNRTFLFGEGYREISTDIFYPAAPTEPSAMDVGSRLQKVGELCSADLAHDMSCLVHNKCSSVPHDIGIHLVELVAAHYASGPSVTEKWGRDAHNVIKRLVNIVLRVGRDNETPTQREYEDVFVEGERILAAAPLEVRETPQSGEEVKDA